MCQGTNKYNLQIIIKLQEICILIIIYNLSIFRPNCIHYNNNISIHRKSINIG